MRKIILIIAFLLISTRIFATEISLKIGNEGISVNGKPSKIVKPFELNGVTLVPLRVIAEAFGANVAWNEDSKLITILKNNDKIVLQIDNINSYINDEEFTLLTAPQIIDETTMVPLRFISEALGATVAFDNETNEISVIKTDIPLGYKQYVNKDLKYSINVFSDAKIDDSVKNQIMFLNNNKKYVEVGIYKQKGSETLDTLRDKYSNTIKLKYSTPYSDIQNTQKILDNNVAEVISYNYDDGKLLFNDYTIFFLNGIYKCEIHYYLETDNKLEFQSEKLKMEEVINSFKIEMITENLLFVNYEKDLKKYNNESMKYSIVVPYFWNADISNPEKYTFYDELDNLKIDVDSIPLQEMYKEEKSAFERKYSPNIFKPKGSNEYLAQYYDKTFRSKGGIFLLMGKWDYGRTKYEYQMPEPEKDFYKKEDIYIFHADNNPKNFKKVKEKVIVCYVFLKNETLITVTCYLNQRFPYEYNRKIYDEIVKSILE